MKIIIANWKMNKNLANSIKLADKLHTKILDNQINCEVVLCPSFPYLQSVSNIIKNSTIKLGGQDCSFAAEGSYTGDISANMLVDSGCQYVILGHSERRIYHDESSERVKQKAEIAHGNNLITIICIGENIYEKDNCLTHQVIKDQLARSLPLSLNENNTIIAYEPVWAIGTGKNPTLEEISEISAYITELINDLATSTGVFFVNKPRIVYGGSVTMNNCKSILNIPTLNGLLVGGASLVYEEFYDILTQI